MAAEFELSEESTQRLARAIIDEQRHAVQREKEAANERLRKEFLLANDRHRKAFEAVVSRSKKETKR